MSSSRPTILGKETPREVPRWMCWWTRKEYKQIKCLPILYSEIFLSWMIIILVWLLIGFVDDANPTPLNMSSFCWEEIFRVWADIGFDLLQSIKTGYSSFLDDLDEPAWQPACMLCVGKKIIQKFPFHIPTYFNRLSHGFVRMKFRI